jgi:hypothetical protein
VTLKKTGTEAFNLLREVYGENSSCLKHSYKMTSADAMRPGKVCMEQYAGTAGNYFECSYNSFNNKIFHLETSLVQ